MRFARDGLGSCVGLSGFKHPLRVSFLVRPASIFPLQNARQSPKHVTPGENFRVV
jgi:hypothetical protein